MELCLAQFAILSIVERTYSTKQLAIIDKFHLFHVPALLFGVSRLSWLEFSLAISVIGLVEEVVEVVGYGESAPEDVCWKRKLPRECIAPSECHYYWPAWV